MRKEWMSEAVLDSGDPRIGATFDKLADVRCPEDGTPMENTSDEQQPHVRYESCPQCSGLFFDAGEFTDLKYDSLMDRIRDFVKGSRPGSA